MLVSDIDQKAIDLVRKWVPGFKVISKQESRLHRIIAKILAMTGNKRYLDGFFTTIGYTVGVPSRSKDYWDVLFHEGRHAIDAKKISRLLFGFLYLLPITMFPVFVGLSLLYSPWFLIGLVCFAPLPAIFRTVLELRGYKISLAICFWHTKNFNYSIQDKVIENISKRFTGSDYYYMWPFGSQIDRALDSWFYRLKSAEVLKDPYLMDIYNFMRDNGLLKNPY